MHYARALDVHDEFRVGALFQGRLRALFRLFEGYSAEDVVHAHQAYVAHAAVGFPAQHFRVVANQIGQAFAHQKAARIPLSAYQRNHGVLSVRLHHRGKHKREFERSGGSRRESVAVVGHESVALVRLFLGERELLVGEHAVTRGEMVAHVVARAGIARAGRKVPPLQFVRGEIEQLIEFGGSAHERRKAAGVFRIVAFVEREQVYRKALRRHDGIVLVQHFENHLPALSLVQRDHIKRGEADGGLELRRGAAGQAHVRYLAGHQKFGLGRNADAQIFAFRVG